jgi:hypothetical protein
MALLSAAEFRGYYPLLTGTAEDTAVGTVVSSVGALMARTCGYPRSDAGTWTMESATYTRYYDGPTLRHPRCLDLGLWPVVSVTSAHADADWAYGADTLIASGDLVLDGARGLLWIAPTTTGSAATAWLDVARANKVVLVAGYATVPDDLKWLCAQAVRHAWDRRRVQGVSAHQMGGDQQTVTDTDDVLPEAVRRGLYTYTLLPR